MKPLPREIQVSESFIADPEIRPIWELNAGRQLYLAIAPSHLRSQYFNAAILALARLIESRGVNTVSEMERLLDLCDRRDEASCYPWRNTYSIAADDPDPWYHKRHLESKAIWEAKESERKFHLQEIIDAIHGINPFTYAPIRNLDQPSP